MGLRRARGARRAGRRLHVVGLTATPPGALPADDAELYAALLGPVDFTVPTPAVVRDGHLAPYQELAWLTEPLGSERAWLAEHDTRLRELVTALHDDAEGELSFPAWVLGRARERRRGRTAILRPLLVSGRGLRCAPADAEPLRAALERVAGEHYRLGKWVAEADGALVSLYSSGAEWVPRVWVDLATRLLVLGTTRTLVATRALLGEGWDCPPVNVLVDLTVAATGVSVQQMRGSSLRLDPDDPRKPASNWDVVCSPPASSAAPRTTSASCAAPPSARPGRGRGDRGGPRPRAPGALPVRAAGRGPLRRHRPRSRGARRRARRGAGALAARAPYRGVEVRTLVARRRSGPAPPAAPAGTPPISQRVPLAAGAAGAAACAARAAATGAVPLLAGLACAPAGLGWAALRLGAARRRLPAVLPLDRAANAVAEAYRDLGELTAEAAATVELEPRAAG